MNLLPPGILVSLAAALGLAVCLPASRTIERLAGPLPMAGLPDGAALPVAHDDARQLTRHCIDTFLPARVSVMPAAHLERALGTCQRLQKHVKELWPSDGANHLLGAVLASVSGEPDIPLQNLRASQMLAPSEGWLAERRLVAIVALLQARSSAGLGPQLTRLLENETATLLGGQSGTELLAAYHIRRAVIRGTVSGVVDRAPEPQRRRFRNQVRKQSGGKLG